MENDKSYNGWSNYETWVVKLWMDNSEGDYRYWLDEVQDVLKQSADKDEAIAEMRDRLQSQHEENLPEVKGFAADLLNAAMSEVDWHEIATALVGDHLADNPEDDPEYVEPSDDDDVQPSA